MKIHVESSPGSWFTRVVDATPGMLRKTLSRLAKNDAVRLLRSNLLMPLPLRLLAYGADPEERWWSPDTMLAHIRAALSGATDKPVAYDCEDWARCLTAMARAHGLRAEPDILPINPRLLHAVSEINNEEVDLSGYLQVGRNKQKFIDQVARYPQLFTWE